MQDPPHSSPLWATTSKEWVIPPKPKPGRKPKRDSKVLIGEGGSEDKMRRVQNRTAQRAFRERKQHQLVDLKARLELYEQGEIERNVALQAVSKRLKEENITLKKENMMLRAQVQLLQDGGSCPVASDPSSKKREGEILAEPSLDYHRKRPKADPGSTSDESTKGLSAAINSVTELSTFNTVAPSVLPDFHGQNQSGHSVAPDYQDMINCGLCSTAADCLCRKILDRQSHRNQSLITSTPVEPSAHRNADSTRSNFSSKEHSILDNLPAFQPAIALRPRSPGKTAPRSVFLVQMDTNEPVCSGDPSNCAACVDDPFGQAFCAALDIAADSMGQCDNCPRGPGTAYMRKCGDGTSQAAQSHHPEHSEATISREKAWKVLKSHPNVPFADLQLLAEVVAKNSGCPGPHRKESGTINNLQQTSCTADEIPRGQVPPLSQNLTCDASVPTQPALVPQNILIECGRKRLIHVREEGVREALRLLDARLI